MITGSTTEEAMSDFISASSRNFHTALSTYTAFPRVAEKLVSDFAYRIERSLSEEPGWKIVCNTLASSPREQYAELRWAPVEWESYGWGISLSAETRNASNFVFGVLAASADSKEASADGHSAMPEADRTRVGNAVAPVLHSFGEQGSASLWWPRYGRLRSINRWMEPPTLLNVAYATGLSEERNLVSGKPMDEFVTDLFRAAKLAIDQVLGLRDIRPSARLENL